MTLPQSTELDPFRTSSNKLEQPPKALFSVGAWLRLFVHPNWPKQSALTSTPPDRPNSNTVHRSAGARAQGELQRGFRQMLSHEPQRVAVHRLGPVGGADGRMATDERREEKRIKTYQNSPQSFPPPSNRILSTSPAYVCFSKCLMNQQSRLRRLSLGI